MCKRLLAIVSAVLGLSATGVSSQKLPPAEQAFLDQHMKEVVTTQATRVTNPDVAAVFAVPIYSVRVEIKEDEGSSLQTILVARVGERLVGIFRPSGERECPEIHKLIRPDFKLSGDAAAATFQRALDAVYPIGGGPDESVKAVRHQGTEWTFVRGSFFENKMGFVLTTNAAGRIVSVKYALKLPA